MGPVSRATPAPETSPARRNRHGSARALAQSAALDSQVLNAQ